MFKRLVLALLGATMLVGGVAIAPAQADQRPCVSRAEYQDIKWGWPSWYAPAARAQTNDHFDTAGRQTYYSGPWYAADVKVTYPKCREWNGGYGRVGVWFDNYTWNGEAGAMRVWAMRPNPWTSFNMIPPYNW